VKILLVEDDKVISEFIKKGLQEASHSVKYAADGLTGLQLATTEQFDLAIIDLMLPAMDGLTLVDNVRAQKINLPIIILSAKRSVDERITGLQHGGDDYLTKPFSFSELLARAEALMRERILVA